MLFRSLRPLSGRAHAAGAASALALAPPGWATVSAGVFASYRWGRSGDIPVVGDWDNRP